MPIRRIIEASASFRERGGRSIMRSGATSDLPGLVISIRSENSSICGPAPVIVMS